MAIDSDERTAYIIQRLSEKADPNDIIYDLCQKANLCWPDAEALVRRIQSENDLEITRKQFPLLFALAFILFLGGLALIGYGTYIIFTEFKLFQAALQNIPRITQNMDAFESVYAAAWAVFGTAGAPLSFMILGIGMVLGSLLGLRDAWSVVLNR